MKSLRMCIANFLKTVLIKLGCILLYHCMYVSIAPLGGVFNIKYTIILLL